MKKIISCIALTLSCFFCNAQDINPAQTLKIGDPVPAITVTSWVKGTPQENLKKGKVYVLEFWATWCGPCILAMPHLSHLAEEHPDATFISVNASENADNPEKVVKFVEEAGPMMNFNVAYDVPKGEMSKNWLQASGRRGIPASFVVTKEGKLGWMGHPMMGLEEAVKLALEGKLTTEAAQQIDRMWVEKQAKGGEHDKALKQALAVGNKEEALRLNDLVVENCPYMVVIASGKKYALLTAIDPKRARAYGESLLMEQGNAPRVLNGVASTIFDGSDARVLGEVKVKITGEPDYELAKMLLTKAQETSTGDRETERYWKLIQEWENKRG